AERPSVSARLRRADEQRAAAEREQFPRDRHRPLQSYMVFRSDPLYGIRHTIRRRRRRAHVQALSPVGRAAANPGRHQHWILTGRESGDDPLHARQDSLRGGTMADSISRESGKHFQIEIELTEQPSNPLTGTAAYVRFKNPDT